MLKCRRGEFDKRTCVSIVQQEMKKEPVTDKMLQVKGKKCFDTAVEMLKDAYPEATLISKNEFAKYSKIFAIRGFAGRGCTIKVCHDNFEIASEYCVLFGLEIYQKLNGRWHIVVLGNEHKYKDVDSTIPVLRFDYAPTGNKFDDAYFENPLSEYIEYFGVN